MKNNRFYLLVMFIVIFGSCANKSTVTITVKNNSNRVRNAESVVIPLSTLRSDNKKEFTSVCFENINTGEMLPAQLIDKNGDGKKEEILFQPTLAPNAVEKYHLEFSIKKCNAIKKSKTTYSRFVPERIDDYAWENDRVAFRTFGPKAQLLLEENRTEGKHSGVISSGIDCWLKRVDYSVIDKWYKKYTENTGTYHKDTGEGLDNYHVGSSLGCGGMGVWDDVNKQLYTSKNFTKWQTIEEGPIRTSFRLEYKPWEANGGLIKTSKNISLDLGSQLSRYRVNLSTTDTVRLITVGLTLHNKAGVINLNKKEGWFSYWEKLGDSELGTGIVVDPKYIVSYSKYIVKEKDKSHLFVHLKPIDGKIVYYTGYGWKKSKYFSSKDDWYAYLSVFAKNLKTPLIVKFNPPSHSLRRTRRLGLIPQRFASK